MMSLFLALIRWLQSFLLDVVNLWLDDVLLFICRSHLSTLSIYSFAPVCQIFNKLMCSKPKTATKDHSPDDTGHTASAFSTDPSTSSTCIPWFWITSSYSLTANSLYLQIPLWFSHITFSLYQNPMSFSYKDWWLYFGFTWKWRIICHLKLFSYIYKASFVMSGNFQRTQQLARRHLRTHYSAQYALLYAFHAESFQI